MDNEDLAERLQKLREANGYSLRELAEEIGSSANTVMRWEKCESAPSQEMILKLAELYGRDPVWLMFGVKAPVKTKDQSEIAIISGRLELLTKEQLDVVGQVIAQFLEVKGTGNGSKKNKG